MAHSLGLHGGSQDAGDIFIEREALAFCSGLDFIAEGWRYPCVQLSLLGFHPQIMI